MIDTHRPASDHFEVMIIGGGPAGLTAAIWCADLNLRAVLFDDGPQFGGQLGWTFNEIRNYPGFPTIMADDLRQRFIQQAAAGSTTLVAGSVAKVDLRAKAAILADGRQFTARSIIIATGVRRRKLGLPRETELTGKGILTSGVGSRHEAAGRHVIIVGGGDAAVENAVILSETAAQVTLIHRGAAFRARREFVDAAERKMNIRSKLSTEVASIRGNERFEAVELAAGQTGARTLVEADLLLIRIGTQPNTELFSGEVKVDSTGFILVAPDMSTNFPDIYAIGDVAYPAAPTISTATGTAAIATKALQEWIPEARRTC